MTSTEWNRDLSAVSADAEQAHALARGCYVDPAFYDLEVQRLMKPGWHAVARSSQLPNRGDYRSVDLFGEAIVVLRDEAGELHAYSRVCRHRAFPIVTGHGNTKRFVCPYHRWAYDLAGQLKAAPLMERVDGFDRKSCRLPELRLEEWLGFVFVSLDPQAAPLSPRLEPMRELFAPHGLEDLVVIDTLVYDSPWNWKVLVDNFMESYHHLGPHSENLQRSNPAQGSYALDLEGPFAVLENPAVEGQDPFWVAQIFPTVLLALFRHEGNETGFWYEMKIDRFDHFELHIHLLATQALADNEEVVTLIREGTKTVHAEDIAMCDGVQQGLQSELWRPGRLSHQEKALWLFHRYLAEQLYAAESSLG
jgi:phenylpropionate dioxygenase-like ring-hydroxylating dioxygenase large terminal subunit